MSYMFCADLREALELEAQANAEKESVLKELAYYVKTSGSIGITVRRVQFPFSGWAIEADLTFNGEVVRSYPAYDLLVLELNELELAILCRNRK